MKQLIPAFLITALAGAALAAPPEITNVRAEQRDGTKLVDIWYDAADADGDLLKIRIEVSDNDGARYSVPAFSLTGDIGEGIAPGANRHIVWDAGTDWDGEYSDRMRVKVFAVDAKGYPGLEWGDEVPPGGFLLGQDGGAEGSGPSRHVNIPWSYWLSKYEITVGQYCDFLNTAYAAGKVRRDGQTAVYSVEGTNLIENMDGSYLLISIGDNQKIRWNVNNFETVGIYTNYPIHVTWYGAIAFAHFYGYDLPTEAEWEKAARGPDHDDQDEHQVYAWGDTLSTAYGCYSTSGGLKPVGFYNGNQIPVGPDMINGYGLYDMTGNLAEWTLTSGYYGISSYPQQEDLLSPRHLYWMADSICYKGGSWLDGDPAVFKRATERPYAWNEYSNGNNYGGRTGFRVARRNDVERGNATCEIFENFETWPQKTDTDGNVTVTSSSGSWILAAWANLLSNEEDAFSGSKCFKSRYSSENYALYLPVLSNPIVEIRVKAKNIQNENRCVFLYGDNDTYYCQSSCDLAANSNYTTISLRPAKRADRYYICSSDGVLIDDLEIWTIPQATGE